MGWIGLGFFVLAVLLVLFDNWGEKIPYAIISMIVAVVFIMVVAFQEEKQEMNACEDINGEYIVVDKQWTGKVYVDVYGCVQK